MKLTSIRQFAKRIDGADEGKAMKQQVAEEMRKEMERFASKQQEQR